MDAKHAPKLSIEELGHMDSPSGSTESKNSEERLLEDMQKIINEHEFPDLRLNERQRLLSQWRERDSRCMDAADHAFFQHTNFVAEWRVSDGGSISILSHGSIRRRQLREKELGLLSRITPIENEDFRENDPDISNTNHILSLNSEDVLSSEMTNGGGSQFYIVPRIVLLASERLAGL